MSLRRFFTLYLGFIFCLVVLKQLLPFVFPNHLLFIADFWLVFVFFTGITLIAYLLAVWGIKISPELGGITILGALIIKMLFVFALAVVYVLNLKENVYVFVGNFFSLYLFFTIFEIYALLCNLRNQSIK